VLSILHDTMVTSGGNLELQEACIKLTEKMSLDYPNHLIDEGLLAEILKVINLHDKIVQKNVL